MTVTAFERQSRLKEAVRNGSPVLGLFVKIPAIQVIESLSVAGLDFVVLDAEHAAFGCSELDRCILAGRSVGLPVLVRVREPTSAAILQVLDMGAAGVVVPHITSARQAEAIVAATRYEGGTRGFSGMHRAAGYGAIAADEFKAASDASTLVIAQIEDAAGLDRIDEVSAVSDIDALLIGSADLTVSLGASGPDDPIVTEAIETIFVAAKKAGMRSGIFLPTAEKMPAYQQKGASFFVISTDQGLLFDAASELSQQFRTQSEASNGG
jgi:2-keto-3-deoxy-L-rhamnonate aldolase RhmA